MPMIQPLHLMILLGPCIN